MTPRPREPTALALAVAYWSNRWPPTVLDVGAALFPMMGQLQPPEWADLLDRVALGLGVALPGRDAARVRTAEAEPSHSSTSGRG